MSVDRFSELSAKKFDMFEANQQGLRGMLFPYFNYRENVPSPLVGLWLSDELIKQSLETAHYVPDRACSRALKESGTYATNVLVWLGLLVELNPVEEGVTAKISIPEFMVDDYERFTIDPFESSLTQELEERFHVAIKIT